MALTTDLFEPSRYAHVRRPLEDASHLPVWCYTSKSFYRREITEVFRKVWNFLGRADHIPNPGDYFTAEVAGVPLIVLRDRNGMLRAFANTCRHRGARLLQGTGHCPGRVRCPYHSWTYGLDGRLIGAPGMKGARNFNTSDFPLLPVRLETWGGFVFVNFDSDSENLLDYLGDLPKLLQSYEFDNMVCVRRKTYDVQCNWKLVTENSMEDYHTATVHRSTIGPQKITIETGAGNWEAGHLETEKSVATLPDELEAFPWIPTLSGKARTGTYFVLIYPSTTFACSQDGMFWLEVYPRGVAQTEVVVGHAFPEAVTKRRDFEAVVQKYYDRCDISIPEDNHIAEQQQLGLESPLAEPGRVSPNEVIVHSFANWLMDRMLDDHFDASHVAASD